MNRLNWNAWARLADRNIWLFPVSSARNSASRAKYQVAPIWRDLRIKRLRRFHCLNQRF
jgi:hypothetical protein